ncbi:MAG: AGE family epimerase/isomerase [Caulobacter sp.]|nr:AGE family epimerase/isomerase [Vitreoscilla sp.]
MLAATPIPDFRSPAFLRAHIADTMAFYEGRCVDPTGGLFQFFKDDGSVYDARTRHLVSSTRYVFTHAMGARHFGNAEWGGIARHALAFVDDVHARPQGGFAWVLDWHDGRATVTEPSQQCYGLAFVLLPHAHALMAGQADAAEGLERCWQLMEQRFWQPEHSLYADEASADWVVGPYRGQNANMHACEAMQAAWRATKDRKYLDRAIALSEAVTARLGAKSASLPDVDPACATLVWEHFGEDWSIDPDYNRGDRTNIFRPWGFQTGHQTEWTKLLLQLDRLCAEAGLAPVPARLARAKSFFDAAMRFGWDDTHGGLVYGFAPDGTLYDGDKYHWVQAESFGAAAWLATALQESGAAPDEVAPYWAWYDRIWNYAWAHFVDHRYGAWYRILAADNAKVTDEKSPAGKVDYHDMGACWDVLTALRTIEGSGITAVPGGNA